MVRLARRPGGVWIKASARLLSLVGEGRQSQENLSIGANWSYSGRKAFLRKGMYCP